VFGGMFFQSVAFASFTTDESPLVYLFVNKNALPTTYYLPTPPNAGPNAFVQATSEFEFSTANGLTLDTAVNGLPTFPALISGEINSAG